MLTVEKQCYEEYEKLTLEDLKTMVDDIIGAKDVRFFVYDDLIWERDEIVGYITDQFDSFEDFLTVADDGIDDVNELIEQIFNAIITLMEWKNKGVIPGFTTRELAEQYLKDREVVS